MRVVVFGAGGFIGTELSTYLEAEGFDLIRLARSPASDADLSKQQPRSWCLQQPLEQLSESISPDVALLLAHDFSGQDGAKTTLSGYKQILDWLELQQCKRIIFLSSYSAGPHATSLYGRTKHALESLVESYRNTTIVRPGLVTGGGMEQKLMAFVARYRILPAPGIKDLNIPSIPIGTLCIALSKLVVIADARRTYNLHEEPLAGLRNHLRKTCKSVGVNVFLIPTPLALIRLGFWLARRINLQLPVSEDNFRGIIANQHITRASDLSLLVKPASYAP